MQVNTSWLTRISLNTHPHDCVGPLAQDLTYQQSISVIDAGRNCGMQSL
ncbi:hypothetical protein ACFTZB_36715 [Rhodococcus sp. NPDC057014]